MMLAPLPVPEIAAARVELEIPGVGLCWLRSRTGRWALLDDPLGRPIVRAVSILPRPLLPTGARAPPA